MTRPQMEHECKSRCDYCRAGNRPLFRNLTREWVHTIWRGRSVTHCMCGGHELRLQFDEPARAS
jgi:hypothetical protein